MKQYLLILRGLWQMRAPRERLFLAGLAAFIVLALLVETLWSAHQARLRLHQQLPQLQQQLDTLQRQSADIRALQAQPVSPSIPEASLLANATTIARNTGLTLTAGQLQAEGPRRLRLRATLPFDHWLEAVSALQSGAQLRLVQCRIESLDGSANTLSPAPTSAGQVKIDALFALPDPP